MKPELNLAVGCITAKFFHMHARMKSIILHCRIEVSILQPNNQIYSYYLYAFAYKFLESPTIVSFDGCEGYLDNLVNNGWKVGAFKRSLKAGHLI